MQEGDRSGGGIANHIVRRRFYERITLPLVFVQALDELRLVAAHLSAGGAEPLLELRHRQHRYVPRRSRLALLRRAARVDVVIEVQRAEVRDVDLVTHLIPLGPQPKCGTRAVEPAGVRRSEEHAQAHLLESARRRGARLDGQPPRPKVLALALALGLLGVVPADALQGVVASASVAYAAQRARATEVACDLDDLAGHRLERGRRALQQPRLVGSGVRALPSIRRGRAGRRWRVRVARYRRSGRGPYAVAAAAAPPPCASPPHHPPHPHRPPRPPRRPSRRPLAPRPRTGRPARDCRTRAAAVAHRPRPPHAASRSRAAARHAPCNRPRHRRGVGRAPGASRSASRTPEGPR
eukprot:scaffold11521_cov68-Phaeocystis_antarctica.AAC.14